MMRLRQCARRFAAAAAFAVFVVTGCCCRESTMIIRLHAVPLSGCQAEIVRAEKAILDFGFAVESVDFGCRNGTFIDVTVTGRAKRWVEKYTEECQKRIHLEEQLGEGK